MTELSADDSTAIELRPTQRPLSAKRRTALMTNLGFGRVFTEHMVSIHWSVDQGWHDGELRPQAALKLDTATMALHYGQSIFEGLKAYLQVDGAIAAFRPHENARRFQLSAQRMAMPELPTDTFVRAIELLVRQDRNWMPSGTGQSLYLRPFMFATEVGLGIRPSNEYQFLLIASPVGLYFPNGVQPVSVWLSEDFTRAGPGGTGEVKCAGNYAASLVAQAQAVLHGCDQVIWLDAVERCWIEEMGGMNIFFVYGTGQRARLTTPPLTGTLLPGVTRNSLLTLARDLGYSAQERPVSVEEWRRAAADGSITEAFACGTAAIITPIGSVMSESGGWTVGKGDAGPITMQLRNALLDIQHGASSDTHGWIHRIC